MKNLTLLLLILLGFAFAQTDSPEIKPELNYAERQVWQIFLDWPQKYEDVFLQTHPDMQEDELAGVSFYPLEPDWYLLEIQTYLGAYQPGYIYMIYNKSWQEGFLLGFPQVSLQEGKVRFSSSLEMSALPSFDPETKRLTLYSRSRGAGGCGDLSIYRFEYEFAYLVETRAQSCEEADAQGEDMILDPSDWPIIWSE